MISTACPGFMCDYMHEGSILTTRLNAWHLWGRTSRFTEIMVKSAFTLQKVKDSGYKVETMYRAPRIKHIWCYFCICLLHCCGSICCMIILVFKITKQTTLHKLLEIDYNFCLPNYLDSQFRGHAKLWLVLIALCMVIVRKTIVCQVHFQFA